MKKIPILVLLILSGPVLPRAAAQADEIAQLLLNVEKLAQFKQILTDLKKGYEIVFAGYSTVKNLSEGNFNLHKGFLDALLQVNPVVRNYYKVGAIAEMQLRLVQQYKSAYRRFSEGDSFQPRELSYIAGVYSNLLSQSLRNLDELLNVVTADKLRMSDSERLGAIDEIHRQMQEKLNFLQSFNNSTAMLAGQRAREKREAVVMERINGLSR